MKYAYEDLSPEQFEDLTVFICQRLLGIGVQGFAKGPDGGRDAKFVGTAELFPSKSAPWSGIIVIQAKHTNGYNKTFSDSDFFSDSGINNTLAKEIPRIKQLKESKMLDHYILFANRRLASIAEEKIITYISKQCDILRESIYLCGLEQLELWLKNFPEIPKQANIDPIDAPLIVSPDELSEVVQALAKHKQEVQLALNTPPTPRIPFKEKNKINNMSSEYAKNSLRRHLKETSQIQHFLAMPENEHLLHLYETVVEEFQLKIIAKRKDYQTFDEVMEYLALLLFNRDVILRNNKPLTRAVLFYMYWICDIGRDEDDAETK
jgi:hypothetical protein